MREVFKSFSGLTGTVDTVSDVKLLGGKKNPQLGRVTKKTFGIIVQFGKKGLYESKMTGDFDPNFVPKKRAWGVRVDDTCVVEHNGADYVEFYALKNGESSYFLDGKPINKENVIGLNSNHSDNPTQIRCVKIANILGVCLDVNGSVE